MGTGASSNPVRLTLNAGLAASRWKSNAHSTHAESNIPSANLQQENGTTLRASDDNLSSNDIKVEGRNIPVKDNKKAASPAASYAQVGTKQQKAKEKSSESKSAVATSVKPLQFGNKSKSTAKKNVKTVEAKKPSTTAALKSKGRKKIVQGSAGSDLCERVERVLQGLIEENCPVNSRTIRIFMSSTFTGNIGSTAHTLCIATVKPVLIKHPQEGQGALIQDTEHERNALMENVYPKLREFCQKKGYEFQVVDMRWGVRDDATNTHMTTELCLREIKACREISVGPNFVTLLSEKYGYRPLLPSIDAKEFELLLSTATDVQTRELLDKYSFKTF